MGWSLRIFKIVIFALRLKALVNLNCHFWEKITRTITRVTSRILTNSPYTWLSRFFSDDGYFRENPWNSHRGRIRENLGIHHGYHFSDYPSKIRPHNLGQNGNFEISRNLALSCLLPRLLLKANISFLISTSWRHSSEFSVRMRITTFDTAVNSCLSSHVRLTSVSKLSLSDVPSELATDVPSEFRVEWWTKSSTAKNPRICVKKSAKSCAKLIFVFFRF